MINFNVFNCFKLFSGLKETLVTIAIILAVVIAFVALVKFPNGRLFFFSILSIAFIGFTIFAGIELNYYYTAQGGIVGVFTHRTNQIEYSETKFNLKGISLTKESDGTYQAEFSTSQVFDINNDINYAILLNGTPCEYVIYNNLKGSNENLICSFDYLFMDEQGKPIIEDKLFIYCSFFKNSTKFVIKTKVADSSTIDLWYDYFDKNGFEIELKTVDNLYFRTDYHKVDYLWNGVHKGFVRVPDGYDYILPIVEMPGQYDFMGWQFDGKDITELTNIKKDLTVNAIFKHYNNVSFEGQTPDWSHFGFSYINSQKLYDGEKVNFPENPTMKNYKFLGWSIDGGKTFIDTANYCPTKNTTITAIFDYDYFPISIEINNLKSGKVNGQNFTANTNLTTILYNEKIVFSDLIFNDNYLFDYFIVKDNLGKPKIVTDSTFNLSAYDIWDELYSMLVDSENGAPSISSLTITIVSKTTILDVSQVSDHDLQLKYHNFDTTPSVLAEMTNDEYINYQIYNIYGKHDSTLADSAKQIMLNSVKDAIKNYLSKNVEKFSEDLDVYKQFDFVYVSSKTNREFLEQLYINIVKFEIFKAEN